MSKTLRILALFAHPDDELGAGGTLAKYAEAGADITLVSATRGEAATIYCDDCATPDTLAAVRTQELECCCRALGIAHLQWLDWPDGGVSTISEATAVAQLVPIIRRIRPHILITHPEHGTYPHPDHIAVHHRALAAYRAAADPNYDAEAGPAWATPKLYVRVIPESVFDLIPGFSDYRVQLNGQALSFTADPPEHIQCTIDCHHSVTKRINGWACHRSQHNPHGTFSTLSADQQQQIFAVEHFRLLDHHLITDLPPHTTLTAGLADFEPI